MKKLFSLILIFGILLSTDRLYSQNQPWNSRGKAFVRLLHTAQFDSAFARMSAIMQPRLPRKKLEQIWAALESQIGEFQTIQHVKVVPIQKWYQVNVFCQFERQTFIVRVVFNRENLVDGLFFLPAKPPEYEPPEYVQPDSFSEETIEFGLPAWKLPGTLTLPKESGTFPLVILVHGSGPNDRDETIGPNRPFRDLAWGLASNGVAVLRYDKRTRVHGVKMTGKNLTVEQEVIEDVLAAIEYIKRRPEIKINKIFVLGHSLGAMLAPETGTRSKEIAGIIMLAAPARTIEELTAYQLKYLHELKSSPSQQETADLDSVLALLKKIKNKALPDSVNVLGARAFYYYDLQQRDQIKFAKSLSIPCFLLQGERDYQVTMIDFQIWQKELAGLNNVTFKSYPALNHLFIAGTGKSTPAEYMDRQKHVSAEVVRDIVKWILNGSKN